MCAQSPGRQLDDTQSALSYHPLDMLHRGVESFVDWVFAKLAAKGFGPRGRNKIYKPKPRQ